MPDAGFGMRTRWHFNLADKDGVQSVAVAIAGKPGLVYLVQSAGSMSRAVRKDHAEHKDRRFFTEGNEGNEG